MKNRFFVAFALMMPALCLHAQTNTFPSSGNVGIGTTSPNAKLEVVGPGTGSGPAIRASGGGDLLLNYGGALFFDGNYSYAAGNYIRPLATNTQVFVTSGVERLRITPGGNIGIGTSNPTNKFQIGPNDAGWNFNDVVISNSNGALAIHNDVTQTYLYGTGNIAIRPGGVAMAIFAKSDGKVGIGTGSPAYALDVAGPVNDWKARFQGPDGYITIGPANPTWAHIYTDRPNFIFNQNVWTLTGGFSSYNSTDLSLQTHGITRLTISRATGNVGIGTSNPTEKLTVNGTMYGKEVKVDLAVPGPDDVFVDDYQLPSLQELKQFIDAHKHLPEVPAAKEMEANGIELGVMNMLLLKKVEELTLYVIDLEKRNREQDAILREQSDLIKNLQNR